jgi:hypothetical protein
MWNAKIVQSGINTKHRNKIPIYNLFNMSRIGNARKAP